jgi:hypothetical protein
VLAHTKCSINDVYCIQQEQSWLKMAFQWWGDPHQERWWGPDWVATCWGCCREVSNGSRSRWILKDLSNTEFLESCESYVLRTNQSHWLNYQKENALEKWERPSCKQVLSKWGRPPSWLWNSVSRPLSLSHSPHILASWRSLHAPLCVEAARAGSFMKEKGRKYCSLLVNYSMIS